VRNAANFTPMEMMVFLRGKRTAVIQSMSIALSNDTFAADTRLFILEGFRVSGKHVSSTRITSIESAAGGETGRVDIKL
jgi:hypothetical protein